ncbi:hypothetical protein BRE01_01680 [Brevibacillus reuszeri]|uniref:YcdB/YcdC repeated domain-containing protein n=1 Tax=Brevibacillus reuszeri TaxID=54915 RepID=A0A0K9YRJ3_9BACL|nr:YcdB/YcdC domain-containing protein [Brevibacillus reuszeri]KNB71262.1 hypothetical protein ADS79_20855 [Brevibacillus reuszeri]MED1857701.1 hypothetical protein [Brevibacillus reuszeri]GED66466.1 hypothetical protein BRE01_01680 [Brevibacillus reuszeri]
MKNWNGAVKLVIAATLLTASPACAADKGTQFSRKQEVSTQGLAQATIDKLAELLPYMKQLPVQKMRQDEASDVIVIERKRLENDPSPSMTIYLDKKTGGIQSFEYQAGEADGEELPLDVQKKKADSFLQGLLGKSAEEYQFDSQKSEKLGDLAYQYVVNGILFDERFLLVGVNGNGEVIMLMADGAPPVPASLPKPDAAIPLAQAQQAVIDRMTPAYRLQKDGSGMILTYHVSWSGVLDAKTGQSVETEHAKFYSQPNLSAPLIPVSPQSKALIARNKGEAATLLKNLIGFDTADATFVERSPEEGPNGKVQDYVWKKGNQIAKASVKQGNGQVMELSLEAAKSSVPTQKIALEAAKKTAVEVLQTYLNAETKAVALDSDSHLSEDTSYSFTFYGTHNGLPVLNQMYQVTLSKETGKLIGLSGDFSQSANVTYPDPAKIVSREQAAQEYLKNHPLQLMYFSPVIDSKRSVTPLLVYKPVANKDVLEYVDAVSGKSIPSK